jgi:late competence protein required for DNA uptake (superfamily II DNA/RNA helicase)
MRLLGYALTTFVIPFIINMIRKKLGDQQRLLCNKCHGKLQVIDKEGNLYCKNCKMIKIDRKS